MEALEKKQYQCMGQLVEPYIEYYFVNWVGNDVKMSRNVLMLNGTKYEVHWNGMNDGWIMVDDHKRYLEDPIEVDISHLDVFKDMPKPPEMLEFAKKYELMWAANGHLNRLLKELFKERYELRKQLQESK